MKAKKPSKSIDFTYILKLNTTCYLKSIENGNSKQIKMKNSFAQIYNDSLQKPEEFWKDISEVQHISE